MELNMREYLKIINISNWKDGKINGKGVRYHSNGDRYIVHILIIIFSNGDAY